MQLLMEGTCSGSLQIWGYAQGLGLGASLPVPVASHVIQVLSLLLAAMSPPPSLPDLSHYESVILIFHSFSLPY